LREHTHIIIPHLSSTNYQSAYSTSIPRYCSEPASLHTLENVYYYRYCESWQLHHSFITTFLLERLVTSTPTSQSLRCISG